MNKSDQKRTQTGESETGQDGKDTGEQTGPLPSTGISLP